MSEFSTEKTVKNSKRKKIGQKTLKEWLFAYAFLIYPIILFLIFYVYVNLNSFALAFQQINIDGSKEFVGFDNFKFFFDKLFSSGGLIKISFVNSLISFFIGLIITLPLQLVFSYLMFKEFRGYNAVRLVIMMPSIISSFVYSMVFRNFAGAELQTLMRLIGFKDFPNLLDDSRHVFGTTIFYDIWLAFSTSLIVYPNAMRGIDPSIFESARIDGMCTMWQEMTKIILPLIFPTLSTFLVLSVAGMMTSSGPLVPFYMYSAPPDAYRMGYWLTIRVFNESNPMNFPGVSAAGMILTLFVAPLTLFVKWFLDKVDPTNEEKIYGKK